MTQKKGRFGIHGGQYIPETLMNAVIELEGRLPDAVLACVGGGASVLCNPHPEGEGHRHPLCLPPSGGDSDPYRPGYCSAKRLKN